MLCNSCRKGLIRSRVIAMEWLGNMNFLPKIAGLLAALGIAVLPARSDSDVYLLGVPDYYWYAGCFGTATGNLMGYWDRHGLTEFYGTATNDLVAPLFDDGVINQMWASTAHMADYYVGYESTASDPYVTQGRPEHQPNCIGDFIGLSQKKWADMAGECDGNIDAYSFVYWDTNGNRRINYVPSSAAGSPARDIQSGLREWTKWRGYDAEVFTQLSDFNPQTPAGRGFTFEDLKAEINAGYPVMAFLQPPNQSYRALTGMPRANPAIHGVLIYGYEEYPEFGSKVAHVKTSWGTGPTRQGWTSAQWLNTGLSVRGIIGFRPKPRVRSISRAPGSITLKWDGPSSEVFDALAGSTTLVHRYQVERATVLSSTKSNWLPVGDPTTELAATFSDCCGDSAFYRVKLLEANE